MTREGIMGRARVSPAAKEQLFLACSSSSGFS